MPEPYSLILVTNPDPADEQAIRDGLSAYNLVYGADDRFHNLVIIARDEDGRLIGGLLGGTIWSWLHVGWLWLEDSARFQGLGSRLLAMAEDEARQRNCQYAQLETHEFQALDFYLQRGYSVFAELADCPPGHTKFFLKKSL